MIVIQTLVFVAFLPYLIAGAFSRLFFEFALAGWNIGGTLLDKLIEV